MVFVLFLICAAAYDPLIKHAIKWFQALYFLSSFFGATLAHTALCSCSAPCTESRPVRIEEGYPCATSFHLKCQAAAELSASRFAGQFGPNATTWLLPGEVFPTDIRATCHGISAATGKVGALVAG